MMARWEARLLERQPRTLKGDEVADDEDDDAVRTSVLQDQMTATLCTEELLLSTRYILLSLHIRWSTMWGGGGDLEDQHDTYGRPSWVSHLLARPHCGLQVFRKDQIFSYNDFVTGKKIKPFFLSRRYNSRQMNGYNAKISSNIHQ
jgi:hypothetical protein